MTRPVPAVWFGPWYQLLAPHQLPKGQACQGRNWFCHMLLSWFLPFRLPDLVTFSAANKNSMKLLTNEILNLLIKLLLVENPCLCFGDATVGFWGRQIAWMWHGSPLLDVGNFIKRELGIPVRVEGWTEYLDLHVRKVQSEYRRNIKISVHWQVAWL